jgi:hypothetical protein
VWREAGHSAPGTGRVDDGRGYHDLLIDETRIQVDAGLDGPLFDTAGRDALGAAGSVGRAHLRGHVMGWRDTESQDKAGCDGVRCRGPLHRCVLPPGL